MQSSSALERTAHDDDTILDKRSNGIASVERCLLV